MIRVFLLLTICWIFTASGAVGESLQIIKKNFQSEWQVETRDGLRPFSTAANSRVISFYLDTRTFSGDVLAINSTHGVAVFVNGKLMMQKTRHVQLPVDSLSAPNLNRVFVSLYSDHPLTQQNLSTVVASPVLFNTPSSGDVRHSRLDTFFHDFVVTAVVILLVYLILIIRLSPQTFSTYFSITGIFSLREGEDDQYAFRITSANILYYGFTSLMLSLLFLIVTQFSDVGVERPIVSGYIDCLLTWLSISLLVLGILFLKIIVIYIFSALFRIQELAGFHFFNFIRLLLITTGLFVIMVSGYFILYGQQASTYKFFYSALSWIVGGWMILLFFKFMSKVPFTAIHLFSYICATEIVPFLLAVKILYE